MTSSDHSSGNLYQEVLELAKREIDEAVGQMEDLKRSIQLLEARVEAAKSIYESVAARLNLEDEGASGYASAYEEPPKEVPEPPAPAEEAPPPVAAPPQPAAATPSEPEAVPPATAPSPPEPAPAEPSPVEVANEVPTDDLSLIRQHLAQKLDGNGAGNGPAPEATPAPAPAPPSVPAEPPASTDDKDAFSMDLIRRHLAEKAQTDESTATQAPPPPPAEQPDPAPAPEAAEPSQGGLSDADRELIGAYLRSKQS